MDAESQATRNRLTHCRDELSRARLDKVGQERRLTHCRDNLSESKLNTVRATRGMNHCRDTLSQAKIDAEQCKIKLNECESYKSRISRDLFVLGREFTELDGQMSAIRSSSNVNSKDSGTLLKILNDIEFKIMMLNKSMDNDILGEFRVIGEIHNLGWEIGVLRDFLNKRQGGRDRMDSF